LHAWCTLDGITLYTYTVRLAATGCYPNQLRPEADLWSSLNATNSLLPEDPAQTYLYPNATFNCSGFISSATYVSLAIGKGNGRPLLVIYNDNGDGTYTSPGGIPLDVNYSVLSTVNSSVSLRVVYFDPPKPFAAGSMVGVHLPQASVEKYRLLFYSIGTTNPVLYGYRLSRIAVATTFNVASAIKRTVLPALYLDLCEPHEIIKL
jgi:hypothetical protein